jgi:hypothetical protein
MRYHRIRQGIAYIIGTIICLLVVTPLAKVFGGSLNPDEAAAVTIAAAIFFFLWLNKHKFMTCPICRRGKLNPVDLGSVEDKLGITDHPMFRENSWTQWYQCRFCGHREWDEEENPPE